MVTLPMPVAFDGGWTDAERQAVNDAVRPHAEYYASIFGSAPPPLWHCTKERPEAAGPHWYTARKHTRSEDLLRAESAEQLAALISATYAR